jgi:hypothetical protein
LVKAAGFDDVEAPIVYGPIAARTIAINNTGRFPGAFGGGEDEAPSLP